VATLPILDGWRLYVNAGIAAVLLYDMRHGRSLAWSGGGARMKRKTPTGSVSRQLDLLKTREEQIRRQRIAVLRRELEKTRQRARSLEKELRLLGDREAMTAAGKVRWDDIYEQLGRTFTARGMEELTGASPNLVGSIVFRWKAQGRIVPTSERGVYRKTGRAGRT
jgi:hypothetical protein